MVKCSNEISALLTTRPRGLISFYLYVRRSHDGFDVKGDGIVEPKRGSNFASQRIVFDNLGQGVLDNAFEGTVIYHYN